MCTNVGESASANDSSVDSVTMKFASWHCVLLCASSPRGGNHFGLALTVPVLACNHASCDCQPVAREHFCAMA